MDNRGISLHFLVMQQKTRLLGSYRSVLNLRIKLNMSPGFRPGTPHWHWQPAPFQDYDLWCVQKGSGHLVLDQEHYALSPGAAFILYPGARLQATQNPQDPVTPFSVHFSFLNTRNRPVAIPPQLLPKPGLIIHSTHRFFQMAAQAAEAYRQGEDFGREQARVWIWLMILHIYKEFLWPPALLPHEERLRAMLNRLPEQLHQRIPINDLARQCSLSVSQFQRHFRALTAVSPRQYVIRQIIERACQLLTETTLTTSQIADALGYHDVFFFCRQFKKKTAMTPMQYRNKTVSVQESCLLPKT